MSRTSRIPHPPGTRYVPIYAWACTRFGLAGAAIIGLLEFLDRAEELPEQPLASRARIIADLQGLVGRNAVDAALDSLVKSKAVSRHIEIQPGKNNIMRLVRYGLDLPGLEQLLGTPEIGNSRSSRNRESPKLPESGPKSGVPSYIGLEIEEAAPRAHARGTGSAAADQTAAKRDHPLRIAGMECWYPTEDPEARAIVATHNQESIQSAVAAIKLRPNSAGKKTSPVPALVKAELDHMSQVAIAQQEAQYLAEVTSKVKLNPAAQAVGEQILDKARKKLSAKHLQVGT